MGARKGDRVAEAAAPPLSDADLTEGVRLADELAANFPNELNARKGIIRRQLAVMVGALLRDRSSPAGAHPMTVTVTEADRIEFEKWAVHAGQFTDWSRYGDGYAKPLPDLAWRAWQAARARPAPAAEGEVERLRRALREAQAILAELTTPDMSRTAGDIYFRAVAAEVTARELLGNPGERLPEQEG